MAQRRDDVINMDELLKKISDKFQNKVLKTYRHSDKRAYIDVDPKDAVDFVRYLFKDLGLRFNIASAVDDYNTLEIIYHFSLDHAGLDISLRAVIQDKQNPSIDTITTVTRSAWWIEREIHELFGIDFKGNADLRRLLLPDEWPQGIYPLRKSFVVPKRDSRKA